MPDIFDRFLAILLVPCVVFSHSETAVSSQRRTSLPSPITIENPALFRQEAFIERALWFQQPLGRLLSAHEKYQAGSLEMLPAGVAGFFGPIRMANLADGGGGADSGRLPRDWREKMVAAIRNVEDGLHPAVDLTETQLNKLDASLKAGELDGARILEVIGRDHFKRAGKASEVSSKLKALLAAEYSSQNKSEPHPSMPRERDALPIIDLPLASAAGISLEYGGLFEEALFSSIAGASPMEDAEIPIYFGLNQPKFDVRLVALAEIMIHEPARISPKMIHRFGALILQDDTALLQMDKALINRPFTDLRKALPHSINTPGNELSKALATAMAGGILVLTGNLKGKRSLGYDVVGQEVLEVPHRPGLFSNREACAAAIDHLTRNNSAALRRYAAALNVPTSGLKVSVTAARAGAYNQIVWVKLLTKERPNPVSFALVTSASEKLNGNTEQDAGNMEYLYKMNPRYLPRVFGQGEGQIMRNGRPAKVQMFADEWLEGFGELAVRRVDGAYRFYMSVPGGAVKELSPEEASKALREISKLLTVYDFAPDSKIIGWFDINRGDFVARRGPGGTLEVKMITVRDRNATDRASLLFWNLQWAMFPKASVAHPKTGEASGEVYILSDPASALQGIFDGMLETDLSADRERLILALASTCALLAQAVSSNWYFELLHEKMNDDTHVKALRKEMESAAPDLHYYSDPKHWNNEGPIPMPKGTSGTSRPNFSDDPSSPSSGRRHTLPVRTGEFGNPLEALKMPPLHELEAKVEQVNTHLLQDRLYYDVGTPHILWLLRNSKSLPFTLAPDLSEESIRAVPDGMFVLGRIAKGGPFVIRSQSDALWGWDVTSKKDFASAMEISQQAKLRLALLDALEALGKNEEDLTKILAQRKAHLRFELRDHHDYPAEHDRYTQTIIIHARYLDDRNAMLGILIDELRHIFEVEEDEANTAPALKAWAEAQTHYKAAGWAGLRAGLIAWGVSIEILAVFDRLVRNYKSYRLQTPPLENQEEIISQSYSDLFLDLSRALLKERGVPPLDPFGRPRRTAPIPYAPDQQNFSFEEALTCLQDLLSHREETVRKIVDFVPAKVGSQQAAKNLEKTFTSHFIASLTQSPTASARAAELKNKLEFATGRDRFRTLEPYLQVDAVRLYKYWVDYIHQEKMNLSQEHRRRWAEGIFSVFVLDQLADLTLRLGDDAQEGMRRHAALQKVLEKFNAERGPYGPHYVRRLEWLPLARKSLPNQTIKPYFELYERFSQVFDKKTRIAFHKAQAKLIAQHLRADLYQRALEAGRPIDAAIWDGMRAANMVDYGMLVRDLNALLEAYAVAREAGDEKEIEDLEDAIFQGLSGDPELLLLRHDLLGAYAMIENLFIETDSKGDVHFTAMGEVHFAEINSYKNRLKSCGASLLEKYQRFNPAFYAYSPFGNLYTFASGFLDGMAERALFPVEVSGYSLEDAYRNSKEDRLLAWAHSWSREFSWVRPVPLLMRDRYRYSSEYAQSIFNRTAQALEEFGKVPRMHLPGKSQGRYYVVSGENVTSQLMENYALPPAAAIRQENLITTNPNPRIGSMITSKVAFEEMRDQGFLMVAYLFEGEWYGISKVYLSEGIAQGRDVVVSGIHPTGIKLLLKAFPEIIVLPEESPFSSGSSKPGSFSTFLRGFTQALVIGVVLTVHLLARMSPDGFCPATVNSPLNRSA